MENGLQALFYILIYIYSSALQKLAFAQWIFFQVEGYQVKFSEEAKHLKSFFKLSQQKTILYIKCDVFCKDSTSFPGMFYLIALVFIRYLAYLIVN